MRIVLWGVGVGIALLGFVACQGGTTSDGKRLETFEKRLDALEERLTAAVKDAEPVERLVNDAASLDRRVSALESGVRELAARGPAAASGAAPAAAKPPAVGSVPATPPIRFPPSDPAAAGDRPTRLDRTERRTQLRALSDEFRARVAELRNEGGGDRQEETRQVLEWYREQRRAIIRGGGRTDQ